MPSEPSPRTATHHLPKSLSPKQSTSITATSTGSQDRLLRWSRSQKASGTAHSAGSVHEPAAATGLQLQWSHRGCRQGMLRRDLPQDAGNAQAGADAAAELGALSQRRRRQCHSQLASPKTETRVCHYERDANRRKIQSGRDKMFMFVIVFFL
uniref:(northern house mosquito) hypothetical protein n=1 Tax=Culex pipiens TaxID=7175 RepID=A0A8D8P4H7_CULPI